jgi:hypothetical protein
MFLFSVRPFFWSQEKIPMEFELEGRQNLVARLEIFMTLLTGRQKPR